MTAPITPSTDEIFEKLKSLAPEYHEVGEDDPARVTYRKWARDTVVVESWFMPSGKEEFTVFHMDNGVLVATHYCGVGLQSTMHMMSEPVDGFFEFKLHSISNLADPADQHNSGFAYRFDKNGDVHRKEVWTREGEDTVTQLTLRPTVNSR